MYGSIVSGVFEVKCNQWLVPHQCLVLFGILSVTKQGFALLEMVFHVIKQTMLLKIMCYCTLLYYCRLSCSLSWCKDAFPYLQLQLWMAMFAGSTSLHEKLEQAITNFVGKPAAMVYGMGFATNSTTILTLIGKVGVAL